MHFGKLFQFCSRRGASYLRAGSVVAALLFVSLGLTACGKSFYFAGRNYPPSGILNRVLIAVQNTGSGQLFLVDGLYDVRHNYNNTIPSFPISGFTGLPLTIQNLPAEQSGLVFSSSTGALSRVNYGTESAATLLPAPATNEIATSIFASTSLQYIVAAQQQAHVLEMYDASTSPTSFFMDLPGVYRVSINRSGTVALAFVQNQDTVYSVVHLTADQQRAAAQYPLSSGGPRHYPINGNVAQDCEPQNLPQYCVYPVDTTNAPVDRPIKAVFSPDGSSAYIIDCGPECGGQTAGVTQIRLPSSDLNEGGTGPAGSNLKTAQFIATPGGATDALFSGSTMYVAGQQEQPDGLFTGELSVVDPATASVSAPIPISDGTHERMILADDNTLWIGSRDCQGGERYRQAQSGQTVPYGCMTMFNTSSNTVTTIEPYKGDGTGIAAITALHKVYTAEGGQVYIYSTKDGSALDNANVAVQGVAVDVAYMDAPDDSNNTWY